MERHRHRRSRHDEEAVSNGASHKIAKTKPEGYHKLAQTLMGPCPELAIFRRFGSLEAIRLLSLQAELTQLEVDLRHISALDDASANEQIRKFSSCFQAQMDEGNENRIQWDLISKIRAKMEAYGMMY